MSRAVALLSSISFGMLLTVHTSEAQQVFIPDTNLRAALNEWVPGCVDGSGYLDPQLPDVQAQEELILRVRWSPADLTGIDALSQLTQLTVQGECIGLAGFWLVCEEQGISIPALPPSLVDLSIGWGIYGSLPPWPESLATLAVGGLHGVPSLPSLPLSLSSLDLYKCYDFIELPELPEFLQTLEVELCYDLAGLPPLPSGLQELWYYGYMNGMTELPPALTTLYLYAWTGGMLPTLPASLQFLSLGNFDDEGIEGPWPPGLTELVVGNMDSLAALPAVYPDGLTELRLVTLPRLEAIPAQLPSALQHLNLRDLEIGEVPVLPAGLDELILQGLPHVHCLPLLPSGLDLLMIDDDELIFQSPTAVACLPNLPSNMVYWQDHNQVDPVGPWLLCTVLNSTCEFVNPVATGTVYWDQNADGTRNGGEPGYPLANIVAQPGNTTYGVPPSGDFQLPMPIGQYTLTAVSDNPYVESISPISHDVSIVNATDVDPGNDFGVVLQYPGARDLRIDLFGPWGRPGFETNGVITYQNVGASIEDGVVQFALDANQSWVAASPGPSSVSGNMIHWNFSQLQVGETRTIHFTVYTDPSVPAGTPLEHSASLPPIAIDMTSWNNTVNVNTEVESSFDPNDKLVESGVIEPDGVLGGDELVYTIRFQNTGTYLADRVIITDTLSEDLEWNTMRFISSSHPCTWVLSGDGLLRFTFEPIMLPDSTADEPNSHGFVRFAMKPVDLLPGESVGNIANIYFDFNEPVITNEAVFSMELSTAISSFRDVTPSGPEVWPNPASDHLTLTGTSTGERIEVLDVTGRSVERLSALAERTSWDVSRLLPGSYTVRLVGEGHVRTCSFVKR